MSTLVTEEGRKRYVHGLEWVVLSSDEDAKTTLEGLAAQPGEADLYYVTMRLGSPEAPSEVIGHCRLAGRKGTLYATAATIAQRCPDGIYIRRLAGDSYWMALIADHCVVPMTDRVMTMDRIVETVASIQAGQPTRIFVDAAAPEIAERLREWSALVGEFDFKRFLRTARGVALRRHGFDPVRDSLVIAASIAMIGIFGYLMWGILREDERVQEVIPVQREEELRRRYLGTIRGELLQINMLAGVFDGWVEAMRTEARYSQGMILARIECQATTKACAVSYQRDPRAVAASGDALGGVLSTNGAQLGLKREFAFAPLVLSDEELMRGIGGTGVQFGEVAGMLSALNSGYTIDVNFSMRQLGSAIPRDDYPKEAPQWFVEELRLATITMYDVRPFAAVIRFLEGMDFRVQSVLFEAGYGQERGLHKVQVGMARVYASR